MDYPVQICDVTVLELEPDLLQGLRGTVVKYDDPTLPVALDACAALR